MREASYLVRISCLLVLKLFIRKCDAFRLHIRAAAAWTSFDNPCCDHWVAIFTREHAYCLVSRYAHFSPSPGLSDATL
ncbi:hypothetical protein V8C26DRAFT_402197 [Trichoderma gracile]